MVTGREYRTIMARGYMFSKREMHKYRIRAVYNAVGDIAVMGDAYVNDFARRCTRVENGEVGVIEMNMRGDGLTKVVSVIVFGDLASWHMFALRNMDIYGGNKKDLASLLN